MLFFHDCDCCSEYKKKKKALELDKKKAEKEAAKVRRCKLDPGA